MASRVERMLEWVHVRMKGGYLQLTGITFNLFLPFSLNKGCDWLHRVRTDPLHAGNKASKRLIHSKVTTTAGCHKVVNEQDRQGKCVLDQVHIVSHEYRCLL